MDHTERVGALAILNTGLFTGRVSKGFLAWRSFAEKNPDLPVGFVISGATATDLPDAVVAAYDAPFPTAESKAGAAQFPLLVPMTEDAVGARRCARSPMRCRGGANPPRGVLRLRSRVSLSASRTSLLRPHPGRR